jgi:hypothetical protein
MQTLSSSGATSEELLANFGVDQQDAAQSVAYLKGFAGEMLAVLFNVFSSVAREQRGMVGDVIGQWLSIMTEKVGTLTTCSLGRSLRRICRICRLGRDGYIQQGYWYACDRVDFSIETARCLLATSLAHHARPLDHPHSTPSAVDCRIFVQRCFYRKPNREPRRSNPEEMLPYLDQIDREWKGGFRLAGRVG